MGPTTGTPDLSPYAQPILIAVVDAVGTFAFALSGGLLGVQKRLDLFGVLFLSFVVAVAGGMLRDVLIGAIPPVAITQIHHFFLAIVAGLITFRLHPRIVSLERPILLFDALGLGLFAVVGAQKALEYGINPVMAAILGMLSGIGGGMLRDVLAGNIPFVLRRDFYALAALAAGAIVAIGHALQAPSFSSMVLGAVVCILLRLMAVYRGWGLPIARSSGDRERD